MTYKLPAPDTHCLDDDSGLDCWSYSAALMHVAYEAGAASRDEDFAQLNQDYSAKCAELEIVQEEIEALRADAAKWREKQDEAKVTAQQMRAALLPDNAGDKPPRVGLD